MRKDAVQDLLGELIGAPLRVSVPLAEYTTFRIGGGRLPGTCAWRGARSSSPGPSRALGAAASRCRSSAGGSNVLFDDGGFDGLVVVVGAGRVEVEGTGCGPRGALACRTWWS